MNKKLLSAGIAVVLTLLSLTGCQTTGEKDEKPVVLTTLFPQYDFVRAIAKDYVELEYLLPLGTSAHAYDPTPSDIIKIMDSDLFIYTGSVMEPWIDSDVLPNVTSGFNGLDLSEHVSLMANTHEHEEEEEEEDHHEGEFDPHYWTLPSNAKGMINAIRDELIELLPEKENEIRENADNYLVELDGLDAKWHNLVEHSSQLTIIYGGHFAFGYVGEYYGFETLSPYEGYTPNAEPSPQNIIALIDLMDELNINVVYYEQNMDPKVASAIAEPTNATLIQLNPAANLSADQFNQGLTYLEIMNQNIENLKQGMKYSE